ncbi:hypothetical protein V1512DRAFT_257449 [Lipomyces arxii]|uniref:uncharacterized protein n=1 Tax=Lipomyces arxii TaxID=56418 RepID=UPI0034CD2302
MFVKSSNGHVVAFGGAKEVASNFESILYSVPEGSHVCKVHLNAESGVLTADVANNKLIHCPTINILTNSIVAEDVTKSPYASGAKFCVAPITGGTPSSNNATLTFMLGCSDEDTFIDYLQSIVSLLGSSMFSCGRSKYRINYQIHQQLPFRSYCNCCW